MADRYKLMDAADKLYRCKLGCGPFGQCKANMHGMPSECAAPSSPDGKTQGAPGATDAERAAWLADKIGALGDYAKEAAHMLYRWPPADARDAHDHIQLAMEAAQRMWDTPKAQQNTAIQLGEVVGHLQRAATESDARDALVRELVEAIGAAHDLSLDNQHLEAREVLRAALSKASAELKEDKNG